MKGVTGMILKSILLIIATTITSPIFAKTMDGVYEIPVDDPALEVFNKFKSSLKYNGGHLLNSDKITVTLPQEMMGIANDFVITKDVNGTWTSKSDIFDNLTCEVTTKFECFMDFKQSAIQSLSGSLPDLVHHDAGQVPLLLMDIEKARSLMVNQGLDQDFITNRINIITDFVVEPRGILTYEINNKKLYK